MMRPPIVTTAVVLLSALCSAPASGARAYVIDKLLVGVYAEPDSSAERLGLYATAAEMETLGEQDEFVQVRTPDARVGWIKKVYLTSEPPAVLKLEQLEREREALSARIERLEQGRSADGEIDPEQFEGLVRENTDLKARLAQLRIDMANLKEAQGDLAAAAPAAAERVELERLRLTSERLRERVAVLDRRAQQDPATPWRRLVAAAGPWVTLVILLACFGTGTLAGIYLTDYLNRRRHGGFRV